MRNVLKAETLKRKFPLLAVEHGFIVSKDADLTAVFEVRLPELYTVTGAEYEAIHSAWVKAIRVLPDYSVVCKQDWFVKETYRPDFGKEGQSFLAKSYERHFNERPYLNHYCYLFLTKTTKEHSRQKSDFSTLCRGTILPKEIADKDTAVRFLEAVEQVASAISNPNVAYMVFSVNGKTLVKKLRDSKFGFEKSSNNLNASRSIPTPLQIYGGQQTTTQQFYDSSRTINMNVNLSSIVQNNYYFFEVLSPDAKPNNDDNISTPESVAFSGSGPLWNSSFVWTAYWDVNVPGKGFKWEFRGKGTSPSSGFIADCTFSK